MNKAKIAEALPCLGACRRAYDPTPSHVRSCPASCRDAVAKLIQDERNAVVEAAKEAFRQRLRELDPKATDLDNATMIRRLEGLKDEG